MEKEEHTHTISENVVQRYYNGLENDGSLELSDVVRARYGREVS